MRQSLLARAVVLLFLLALAAPAGAGSLEVLVRDRDGQPLADRWLRLQALSIEDPSALPYSRVFRRKTSDREGRALFDGLPDGTYTVLASGGSGLLAPQHNPFLSPPVVTVRGEEDRQQMVVEYWPGTRFHGRLELPTHDYSGFTAMFVHRETGTTLTQAFHKDVNTIERLLAPGIWEVSMTPRPGFLLVALEHGRIDVEGHSVTLDLALFPETVDLTWTFTAPCMLYGAVVDADGQEPAVGVEATLLRPGPWIEAARRRGGSIFEQVTARVDGPTGSYEMTLPDGEWQVRPVAPLLLESAPELKVLTLDPGGAARADFTVRLAEGAGSWLKVQVVDPGGRGVGEASVAAFPLADEEAGPVATTTSDKRGNARLEAMPEGDYLLVAGHPDFREGRTELLEHDPEHPPQRLPRIELVAGAEVLFEVRDVEEHAVAGVELQVERLDDPPPTRLAVARQRRTARSDHSGRARLRGFYPGLYTLRAERRAGSARNDALVYLRHPRGSLERELEIELRADEQAEVEGRQVPAASFHADLVCGDGWPLPETVSVRVVEAGAELPADPWGHGDPQGGVSPPPTPQGGVVLALDDLVLVGRHRNQLVAGPVADGVYRLAVRPAGFDRWTWAFETYDPRRSTEIPVSVKDHVAQSRAELEVLEIECGPAIDLLPEIAGGEPFPDLSSVAVEARLLHPRRDEEIAAAPPWFAVREGRIELRGLPAAEARLARAGHVPAPPLHPRCRAADRGLGEARSPSGSHPAARR